MFLSAGGYNIALDGRDASSNVNFVSHAHTDHFSGIRNGSALLSSSITKELLEVRGKKGLSLIEEPDCVKLLNSGHIFGSKQLFVNNDLYDYTATYSGDYQMGEPIIGEKIEVRDTNLLILDSTYPYPKIQFDDKEEVITSIQRYALMKMEKGCVIFQAYSLGRAQELTKIFNDVGIDPVVDADIANISKIYEKHGVKLGYRTCELEGRTYEQMGNFVGIFTNSRSQEIAERLTCNGKRTFTAVATGLAKMFRFDTNVQFALSDHADFRQAIEYIGMCNPKLIFTLGREAKVFAKNLAMLGHDARPVQDDFLVNMAMAMNI